MRGDLTNRLHIFHGQGRDSVARLLSFALLASVLAACQFTILESSQTSELDGKNGDGSGGGSGGGGTPVPSALHSTITGSGPVTSDGVDASTITITLRDSAGTPVAGVSPTFATSGSSNTLIQNCTSTNSSGVSICASALKSTVAESKALSITSPVSLNGGLVHFLSGSTVTKTVGSYGRDFSTLQAWENARDGDLTTRHVLAVTGGAGTFVAGETVNGAGGCSGLYVPEDEAVTNGSRMTLDGFAGTCSASATLTGATSGATATFSAVLLSSGTIERAELYKDSAFDERVLIDGSTTDSTHHMWITAAAGQQHQGREGTGVVFVPATSGHVFTVSDDHVRVEWLEVKEWFGSSAEAFRVNNTGFALNHSILYRAMNGGMMSDGVYIGTAGISISLDHVLMYDIERTSVHVQDKINTTVTVSNSTFIRMRHGEGAGHSQYNGVGFDCAYPNTGSVMVLKNTYVHALNGLAYQACNGGAFTGSDYTASDDASAPGSTVFHNVSPDGEFESIFPGHEDFHLKSTASLRGAGTDLSATSAIIDLNGEPRPPSSGWDIGVDQDGRPYSVTSSLPAPSTLVDRGLMARYLIDEAASGQAPAALLDSATSPLNLPLTYIAAGHPDFAAPATGRGLNWIGAESDGRACATVSGTKIMTDLHGATQATYEVVADLTGGSASISRLMHIGTVISSHAFAAGYNNNDASGNYLNFSAMDPSGTSIFGFRFPYYSDAAGRAVLTFVVDTSEAQGMDRVRVYRNGTRLHPDLGALTAPALNAALNLDSASSLCIGNRDEGTNSDRSPLGIISYGAVYGVALTESELRQNVARLLQSDD